MQRPRADSTITSVEVVTVVRRPAGAVQGLALGRQGALCLQVPSLTVLIPLQGLELLGPAAPSDQEPQAQARDSENSIPSLPFSVLTLHPGCEDAQRPLECVCLYVPTPSSWPSSSPFLLNAVFLCDDMQDRALKMVLT